MGASSWGEIHTSLGKNERDLELLLASGFALALAKLLVLPWPWLRLVYLFLCLCRTVYVVHGLGWPRVCRICPCPSRPRSYHLLCLSCPSTICPPLCFVSYPAPPSQPLPSSPLY